VARKEHEALHRNLVLIGGRGCGKSSVSKRIARSNRNFMLFSVDAMIRYEAGGISIPEIVERDGWAGFRELEYRVLEKLAAFECGALIDCGGGAVVELDAEGQEILSQRRLDALHRHGLVVYLRRDVDYLIDRISHDANRPPLSETRSFREVMARREPWYRAAAHLTIDCGERSKSEIVEEALAWFYAEQSG
jgi:shikimate kinase